MIAAVAKVFAQAPVLVVADSWFGNAGLLKPLRAELGARAHLLSRLRVNTVLYDLPAARTPTPGRPRKYGPRLGNPAQLAAALQEEARTYTLNLYGGVREVAAAERVRVVGFSDMTVGDVAEECGLPVLDAQLAKLREFDEPFRLLEWRVMCGLFEPD